MNRLIYPLYLMALHILYIYCTVYVRTHTQTEIQYSLSTVCSDNILEPHTLGVYLPCPKEQNHPRHSVSSPSTQHTLQHSTVTSEYLPHSTFLAFLPPLLAAVLFRPLPPLNHPSIIHPFIPLGSPPTVYLSTVPSSPHHTVST